VIAPRPGPVEYAGHEVVSVAGVALPGYRSFVVGLPVARLEKRLRQFKPDIVHLASPVTLGAAGASTARKLDLPCLAVFQTDVAGFAKRYGLRGTDTAIWSWLRHIHSQADRTLVPSSATFSQLEDRGIPRLAMWRRGVDAVRFHPGHRCETLRSELAPDGETIVGYVGRLAGDKRVDLLNHVAGLPGVKLVVVGDGPAASKLRASMPQAVFTGFLDGPELSRVYASLDVFVHTGADETFCQAVQEAMASGVPVVAPAAGGPLDLVLHERTGLFYATDSIAELREAVMRLSEDPAMRFRFGALGRAAVESRSWASVGDQLLAHYRELVDAATMPAPAKAAA
jgi:phosphatidylinositol alpha 1,6-mannosyltransferase